MRLPDSRTDRVRFLSLLLLAGLCLACGGGERRSGRAGATATPSRGGTAIVCLQTAPQSLDPFVSPDGASVELGALLYTPLVRYGRGESMRPYLARSWSWGREHRELTFHLRTDVKWQDGPPVTAADVAFTLRRAADSTFGYLDRDDFRDLDSVSTRDSATVRLVFGRPLAAGLEPFASLPILPRHLLGSLDAQAFSHASYHHDPVGSGPYRLTAWRGDGTIAFRRAAGFPTALGPDYLDRIVFRVVPEAATRLAELRTGEVDACRVGASQASDVAKLPGVQALPITPAPTQMIVLDTRQPPFTDVRVRRALSAALNRAEIAAVVSPVATPARAPLPPGHPYAAPGVVQPDANLSLADSLLNAAGWQVSSGGAPRVGPGGRRLVVTLAAPPQLENVVTVIQAELERAGFQVKPEVMEFAALIGRIQDPSRRPPAVLLATSSDKRLRPDFYTSLVTGGPTNISSYSSPAVDSAVARLRTADDSAAVAAQYRVLEERVADDLPLVYLIRVPPVLAVGSRLRGVTVGPDGPFASAPDWWIPAAERR